MQVMNELFKSLDSFEGETLAIQVPGITPPPGGGTSIPAPTSTPSMAYGVPKKASPLPLLVCIAIVIASSIIYLLRYQFGGGNWYFLGYVLTPILSSVTLGWDNFLQRNGRKDPWFVPSPLFSRLIRVLVAVSFVVAIFHILEIAHMCGQSVVQSGALCVA